MKTFLKKFLCCTLAALMLITMLAACGKDETSEETQIETSDTEAPKTNDSNTAAFTEAVFTCYDWFSITNVTYNSRNNPVSEKIVGIEEVDGHLDVEYDYNEDGYLTEISAYYFYCDGSAEKDLEFRVEYDLSGSEYKSATVYDYEDKVVSNETSQVTYHENGTVKTLWIGESADKAEWFFEQDEQGRRTVFKDGKRTLTLTYSQDSREATEGSVTWSDYDKNSEQEILKKLNVHFEYENGVISKITTNEENSEEKTVFELSFSEDIKYLTKVICCYYEGAELDEQMSYDFSYTDFGMFKALTWLVYTENGELEGGEGIEYEYDSAERVIKCTFFEINENNLKHVDSVTEIEYDAEGRKIRDTEKWYDENGAEKDTSEYTYEYAVNGKISKQTYLRTNADGTLNNREETTYEYDADKLTKRKYVRYDENNAVNVTIVGTYEYGANGKISKETYLKTNGDGTLVNHTVTTYEYDAGGNLTNTKDTHYDANGNVIS